MDNVWLYDTRGNYKSRIWDAVCDRMTRLNHWKKVVIRTRRPEVSDFHHLQKTVTLSATEKLHFESHYENLLQDRYLLLDMLYRKTDWDTDRYNAASFHELSARIRLLFEFAYTSLLKDEITLVLFCTAPHMGWDYLFYRAATYLNIKTLILDQSKLPNKFFHCFDFEDFGTFNTSKILGDLTTYPIEKKVEKDWFYMKKNQGIQIQLSLEKLIEGYRYKNRLKNIIENNDFLRLFRELADRRRRPQALFRFYTEREYQRRIKQMTRPKVSLKTPYVYFPLHKQPERSTTIWGGIYVDQALAIEKLARIIPKDWQIYIKENPSQRGAYRDVLFFDRLNRLSNSVLISRQENTHELIRHSQFVATVVGTAGWEAITGGKNVLTFGWGAWYQTLPGVHAYHRDIQVDTIVQHNIDHDELQEKTAALVNKCGTGIIDLRYLRSIDTYDLDTSTRTIVESLVKILYSSL